MRTVFGIHTSATDPEDAVWGLLKHCASIKIITSFKDTNNIFRMRELAHPNTVFLGRYIDYDIEQGELHRRFAAIDDNDVNNAYALGVWYANVLASLVFSHNLAWMYWESGPNEHNIVTPKIIAYMEGFIDQCLKLGIMPAVGGYSYGRPKTPPYDSVDEWEQWKPVFVKIDAANKDANGKYLAKPRAILYLHEGAQQNGMMGSIPTTVARYRLFYERHIKPYELWFPLRS